MAAAAIFKKIEKSPYLRNCLSDRREIGHGDAVCGS